MGVVRQGWVSKRKVVSFQVFTLMTRPLALRKRLESEEEVFEAAVAKAVAGAVLVVVVVDKGRKKRNRGGG